MFRPKTGPQAPPAPPLPTPPPEGLARQPVPALYTNHRVCQTPPEPVHVETEYPPAPPPPAAPAAPVAPENMGRE